MFSLLLICNQKHVTLTKCWAQWIIFHLIFLVIVFAPASGILPDVTPETNLAQFLATGGGGSRHNPIGSSSTHHITFLTSEPYLPRWNEQWSHGYTLKQAFPVTICDQTIYDQTCFMISYHRPKKFFSRRCIFAIYTFRKFSRILHLVTLGDVVFTAPGLRLQKI